jgi:hypothetical protein
VLPIGIQNISGSYFNHTGTILKKNDAIYVFEALKEGAVLTPFEKYIHQIRNGEITILIGELDIENIPVDAEKKWIEYIEENAYEIPYDKSNLLLHQLVKYIGRFVKKVFGIKNNRDWWIGRTGTEAEWQQICAELSANTFYAAVNLFAKDKNMIAPEDLYRSNYFKFMNIIDKENVNEFMEG